LLDGELSVFDLSITKLLVLAVIALVVFGPHELPKMAQQAGRALRDLRRIAEGAKADLREGLGPEFQDFDFDDLNPKRFVQKHLLEEPDQATAAVGAAAVNGAGTVTGPDTVAGSAGTATASTVTDVPAPGENPPFDLEAT
jgi:sec-independent protein translocase protein TatB